MTAPTTFTRNPSTKISVDTILSGLVPAENTLVLIGRMAASGSTVTANVQQVILNYGDPVAAATECAGYFGANSEIGGMVVAAIKGVQNSNQQNILFPPIICLPMLSTKTSADLATTLNANIQIPMPFSAIPFDLVDPVASAAYKNFLVAISASDRGTNAQFGSFGVMASIASLSAADSAAVALASSNMMFPSIIDSASTPANTVANIAAAYAAVCASCGLPFLPLNGVTVGSLVPPVSASDWHTGGDAGTIALGLASGLSPLYVAQDGTMRISRTITAVRTVVGIPDNAYFDMQDWQTLYYLRENFYNLAQQPRFAIARATDQKILSLRSEMISIMKTMETLGMLEDVDSLTPLFTVVRSPTNRSAAIYSVPVNVVPGFHNKGIGIDGVTLFDSSTIA
jgi:phage tail sheath gpL-like